MNAHARRHPVALLLLGGLLAGADGGDIGAAELDNAGAAARVAHPDQTVPTTAPASRPARPASKPPPLSQARDTAHLVPGSPLADDPLAPYVQAPAPTVLRTIAPPARTPAPPPGVELGHLLFRSSYAAPSPDGPVPNDIHAAIARPTGTTGPVPGILVLHGGGGACDVAGALRWAQRGYLAVAIDLPSIGNPKLQHSTGAWKQLAYGQDRFAVGSGGDVTTGKLFDAIVTGLDGFKLLAAQPAVDPRRLGITGVSWGGYMTTMLSGLLGDRVRAAYPIFGCGFAELTTFAGSLDRLTPAQRVAWIRTLDAGHRAHGIRAATFFAAAVKDIFFFPPAIMATAGQIPGERNLVFVPNVNHTLRSKADQVDASAQDALWMDWHLKGVGQPFPIITLATDQDADPPRIAFSVTTSRPIIRAQMFQALANTHWQHRTWHASDARPVGAGAYEATLAPDASAADICWYVLVTDDRNVSVSSPIRTVPRTTVPGNPKR